PVAAELVLRDMAPQAHPPVPPIQRAAPRAAAPPLAVRRHAQRRRVGRVAPQAVLLAVARRAARDVAARVARVPVLAAGRRRRPPRRVERPRRVRLVEVAVDPRAEPGALVAADAERLRAVARR